MKKIFIFLFLTSIAVAQNTNRKFENFKKVENTLEINTSDGKYIFKSYSDKIVETSFIPKGETFDVSSHAVVLAPKTGVAKVKIRQKLHPVCNIRNFRNHSESTV